MFLEYICFSLQSFALGQKVTEILKIRLGSDCIYCNQFEFCGRVRKKSFDSSHFFFIISNSQAFSKMVKIKVRDRILIEFLMELMKHTYLFKEK